MTHLPNLLPFSIKYQQKTIRKHPYSLHSPLNKPYIQSNLLKWNELGQKGLLVEKISLHANFWTTLTKIRWSRDLGNLEKQWQMFTNLTDSYYYLLLTHQIWLYQRNQHQFYSNKVSKGQKSEEILEILFEITLRLTITIQDSKVH